MLSEQGRTRGGGRDTQGGRACVLKGSREPRVKGRRKTRGRLDAHPCQFWLLLKMPSGNLSPFQETYYNGPQRTAVLRLAL